MAEETAPYRHGLSNSGIGTCPKCGSDVYFWKEGVTCAKPGCDYSVDYDEYEADRGLALKSAEGQPGS